MNKSTTLVAILGITLLLCTLGVALNSQPVKAELSGETELLLETDKDVYILGENVTITLTNIGNETVEIGGYPAWQIFTYPEEEPVYPRDFAYLAWSLKPEENDTIVWNQYNEFNQSYVEPGSYVIKDTQGWGLTAYFKITLKTTRIKDSIRVEAEGIVLHYENESLWDEDQFSWILEHKTEFRSELIEQFNESLSTYGERGEYAVDANVEFNETRKSTILKCDVLGAVSKSGSRYHATFRWLLRPLGLDFIDNGFEHPENGLYWEGSISGVPTTITLSFPVSVPAWGQPNGHCHAHVWWVVLFGDLNGDGVVNIDDVMIVARAFGSKRGDPNWNETADLDKNGIVNIIDLYKVAREFGKTL